MRGRRFILAAVLVVVIAIAGWWVLSVRVASSEPRLRGKSIEWYVQQMNLPDDGTNRWEREAAGRDATEALREMGPSAVAWLAQRIELKESPGQKRYRSMWQAIPAAVRKAMPAPREPLHPSDSILDGRVLRALVQIGPPAVPVLTNYLDSSRYGQSTRYEIYRELSFLPLKTSGAAALPMLEHNLSVTNDLDRVAAAYAIASIDPSRIGDAVAILRAGLRSSQRIVAADYLGILGSSAEEAAMDLEAALRDPDPQFRERARIALQKVTGKQYPKR